MWGAGRGAQCVLADTQTHGSFISCSDRWLGKRVLPGSGPVCPQPPGPRSSHRASGARSRGPEGGPGGFLPQGSMVYLQFAGGGEQVRQCAGTNGQKGRERSCCRMTGERGVSLPRGQTQPLWLPGRCNRPAWAPRRQRACAVHLPRPQRAPC